MKGHTNKRTALHHQNEGLLFQFILHSYLRVRQVIEQNPVALPFSRLLSFLEFFSFNSSASRGLLKTLEGHCKALHAQYPSVEKENLLSSVARAMQKAEAQDSAGMMSAIKKIDAHLRHLLESFKEDEYVLFFILRRRLEVEHVWGKESIARFFKKNVTIDVAGRYAEKGFDHLLPHIKESIYG